MSFVIETRNSADDEDYVSAIVCRDEDEANEILSQYNASRPGVHTLVDTDVQPETVTDDQPETVDESPDFDPAFSPTIEEGVN